MPPSTAVITSFTLSIGGDANLEENKKNYALWLYPETVRQMDNSMELANCKSRSEFVEKALHFYMGYLTSDDLTIYLSKSLLTAISGMLDADNDRMKSSYLFLPTSVAAVIRHGSQIL